MRHTDLLSQQPDTEACLRVSVIQINLTDKLINLIGEHVLTSPLSLGATTCDKDGCWINRPGLASVYLFHTKS